MEQRGDITRLLSVANHGDPEAIRTVLTLLHDRLRVMAHRQLAGEAMGHTLETDGLVGGVGREDEASGRRRTRPDRLGEALAVALDEPDGALDDGPRAAVVDLEVDPPQAGQQRPEPEEIGRASCRERVCWIV